MFLIWFIGMYIIFILQQITIMYLVSKNVRKDNKKVSKNVRGDKK